MEQEVKLREQKKVMLSYKKVKMRIAVCDIKKDFLEKTKNIIYKYADCHRMDIVVDCYSHGEALLCSKIQYNLIFLGYDLQGKNGLETASALRVLNNFSSIVFISRNTDFVFEAFKVNPYRFLIPPLYQNDFYKLLDEFFTQFGNDYPLWIKNGETVHISRNYLKIFKQEYRFFLNPLVP